jgi:protocatechuate 3,4-dioxygenase beta subunit
VTVYAYNTDAEGYYGENRAEYPPRLHGRMKTDGDGRFELRILPGTYPEMRVPAHIQSSLWGAGTLFNGWMSCGSTAILLPRC